MDDLLNCTMKASRVASTSTTLPPRGSFSAMMVASAGGSNEGRDDESTGYSPFEFLPEDQNASSPSPPPPPPPVAPEHPFRVHQRLRVRPVKHPLKSKGEIPKSQASRRASPVKISSPPKLSERKATTTVAEREPVNSKKRENTTTTARGAYEIKAQATRLESPKSKFIETASTNPQSSIPTPSVHPVDTLAKKLRQQASELTQVYEQLSTQRAQMENYKNEAASQKLENDRLKLLLKQHRQVGKTVSGVTSRRKPQSENPPANSSGQSGCKNTSGALDRKIKEMEEEKRNYELSAKRLEKVAVEVQNYFEQRDRSQISERNYTIQENIANNSHSEIEEQRQYIRVLEEVVHLKASEFQVSSHEELLVVLAELRHSVYERERDIEQLRQQVNIAEEQLLREKQSYLESREMLERQYKNHDEYETQARGNETKLQQQLSSIQRELNRILEQYKLEQSKSSQLQERERQLELRLTKAEDDSTSLRAKLEGVLHEKDSLTEQLVEAKKNAGDAAQKASHWEDEAKRRQIHLDEMNTLQEELLESVAEISGANEDLKSRTALLENELATFKQRANDLQHGLDEEVARNDAEQEESTQRLRDLEDRFSTLDAENQELKKALREQDDMLEMTRKQLAEKIDQFEEALKSLQEQKRRAHGVAEATTELDSAIVAAVQILNVLETGEKDHGTVDMCTVSRLRACCTALGSLLDSFGDAGTLTKQILPLSLRKLLEGITEVVSCAANEMMQSRDSWNQERLDLHNARKILEETCRIYSIDIEQCHQQLIKSRSELSERTFQVELVAIEMESLANQVLAMQAVDSNNCSLLEQIEQLQSDLKLSEDALAESRCELQAQQDENEELQRKLVTVERRLKEQESILTDYSELQSQVVDLASQLDEALSLSEEQNVWNEQLASDLQRREESTTTLSAIIRELEARHRAFSRRFSQLFEQFAAREDDELKECLPFHTDTDENEEDILLRQLQVFPAAVEHYVARCMGRIQYKDTNTERVEDIKPKTAGVQERSPCVKETGSKRAENYDERCVRYGDETGFDEQIELIRDAFRPYTELQ